MKKELNILIIEGNHEEAVLLKNLLEESLLEISSIIVVQTLKQAITEIQNLELDIIFLDLNLPDSTGMNTISRILQFAKKTAVVVFSGLEDKKIGLEAVHKGAQDYLVKGLLNSNMLFRIVNYSIKRKQAERIIKDSAQKWESTFNSITDIVAVISKDYEILEINQAGCDSIGMDKADILGKKCYKLIHGLNSPLDGCPCTKVMYTKQMEIKEISEAGRNYVLTAWPITNANDIVTAFSLSIKDTTERKQTEIELKNQFNRYYTLLQNLDGMVYNCVNDNKWTMNFVSEGCFSLTGYKPEDLIQNKKIAFKDVILPEYRDIIWKEWQDKLTKKKTVETTYQIKTASGKIKWVFERGQGVFDEKGKLLHLEGYITDITERKRAEEELRLNRKLLRDVLDRVPVFICAKNLAGKFILINKKLTDFYGSTVEAMTNVMHADLCEDENELRAMLADDREVIESGKPKFIPEETMEDPDGSTIVLETYKIPFTAQGKPAVLIASNDITERKSALEEIERLAKFPSQNPNPVLRVKQHGTVLYSNEAGEQLLNEWQFKNGKIHQEKCLNIIRNTLEDGKTKIIDIQVMEKTYSLVFSPIKATDFINIYGMDITDRKKAEETLQESEAKLRATFAAMTDIIIVYDSDGYYIEIAPTKPSNLFLPLQEMIGKTVTELFPRKKSDLFLKNIRQTLKTKQLTSIEYSLNIDGKDSWFSALVSPLSDNTVIWVARDITDNKLAEISLHQSEVRFLELVNTINSGVGVYKVINDGMSGADYIVQEFNKAALKMEGLPKEKVVGKSCRKKFVRFATND